MAMARGRRRRWRECEGAHVIVREWVRACRREGEGESEGTLSSEGASVGGAGTRLHMMPLLISVGCVYSFTPLRPRPKGLGSARASKPGRENTSTVPLLSVASPLSSLSLSRHQVHEDGGA